MKEKFLKELVDGVKSKQILTIEDIELIEDEVERLEEFLKTKKELPPELEKKNEIIRNEAFYKRIEKILGFKCEIDVERLIQIKNEINKYKEIYGYDDMSEEEKYEFEEKLKENIYSEDKVKEEDLSPEMIDKTEARII